MAPNESPSVTADQISDPNLTNDPSLALESPGRVLDSFQLEAQPSCDILFTPDSRHALVVGPSELSLFDLAQGSLVKNLGVNRVVATCAAISPDGQKAAAGHVDGTVTILDLIQGGILQRFATDNDKRINVVAFSHDGTYLAAGGLDDSIRLWNLGNKQLVCQMDGHAGGVAALAFTVWPKYCDGRFKPSKSGIGRRR